MVKVGVNQYFQLAKESSNSRGFSVSKISEGTLFSTLMFYEENCRLTTGFLSALAFLPSRQLQILKDLPCRLHLFSVILSSHLWIPEQKLASIESLQSWARSTSKRKDTCTAQTLGFRFCVSFSDPTCNGRTLPSKIPRSGVNASSTVILSPSGWFWQGLFVIKIIGC